MEGIDLHIHTTASDGTLTPSETVQMAKRQRLKAIAITDHDTVDGVREALEEGRRVSLEIIPGIEISANTKTGHVHLLGYFVETKHGILKKRLERLKQARSERNPKIVNKLNSLGVDISYQEVVQESGGGQVGRPHFAQVLVNHGYASSISEAFNRYLGLGAPAYVHKFRFETDEAIDIILKTGGVPVLAHPFTLDRTAEEIEALVTDLVQKGLKGIEVFYPDHSREQIIQYRKLSEKLGLVRTGGSDFHGKLADKGQLGVVGNGIYLTYTVVEELLRVKHEIVLRTLSADTD